MKHFAKFTDMTEALAGKQLDASRLLYVTHLFTIAATAAIEGKMSKSLKKILKKVFTSEVQEQLAVADSKLGSVIKVRALRTSSYPHEGPSSY